MHLKLFDKIQNGVYTIAEMSANHAGKLENALEIVHAAKQAGADCLKIQTYTADSITLDCDNEYFKIHAGLWDGYNLYKLYQEAGTPYEWQATIKAECDKIGIDFLSTPFDEAGADFLESLGVEMYKVASFELVHIPLIKHIARKGKPMIVSCGMGSVEEIQEAVDAILGVGLSRDKIILLKCTSEYPATLADMNLATIPELKSRFNTIIGLSDHSLGSLSSIIAVSIGARVVEKHFCLSRKLKNPDSEFSTEPQEFTQLVNDLNDAYAALGSVKFGPSGLEKGQITFRRSIFAVADIAVGERFTKDNIRVIRPGNGLKPKYYDELLEKVSGNSYKRGEPIKEVV
jgi:pseudaminic acid synthase